MIFIPALQTLNMEWNVYIQISICSSELGFKN